MYGSLDIAVSGMVAQRMRMDVISSNLAGRDAILDANGQPNPFRRKIAVMMQGDPSGRTSSSRDLGVHMGEIRDDPGEFRRVWDPNSPYARPKGEKDEGYVYYPNVDPVTEQINAVDAVRAYEANATAAEVTKTMMAQALRLIA
jgi:flagellar basal-body rod protein FlgC